MSMMESMMATSGIHYVQATPPRQATGKLRQIYDQISHDFTLAGPFTLHSPQPDLVAAVWSAERETMFHGIVPRGHKEAVVAAVATINECPYCIDAHTMMMGAADEGAAGEVIYSGSGQIQDERIQRLVDWAKATRTPQADIILNPSFTREEAPEIIGGALAFHYINRMVNIFLEENMMPMPLGPMKGMMRKVMAGTMIKSMLQRKIEPGASLQFLPQADLPDEFAWAADNDILSRTFAGINAAIENSGRSVVSDAVLSVAQKYIDTWHGEDTGMSRAWVNEVTAGLNEKDAIAARMILLAGLASYQVSESDINAFRQHYPTDADLIAVTAWGAWAATRRISSWLHVAKQEPVT